MNLTGLTPFSPVMANLAADSTAEESASLTLDKRESLGSKLLCSRLSVLSQDIGMKTN